MNQRIVLEHRIGTLDGLLDAPGGPLGPNAGSLGDRLRADWQTERRLLSRLLEESDADDVTTTIRRWRERTSSFVTRCSEGPATWSDKQGQTWHAATVLQLLDETEERIDRWLRSTAPPIASDELPDSAARPQPNA